MSDIFGDQLPFMNSNPLQGAIESKRLDRERQQVTDVPLDPIVSFHVGTPTQEMIDAHTDLHIRVNGELVQNASRFAKALSLFRKS